VTRIHSDEESYAVRFPLRRQRPNEFSLADGSGENVRTDAVVAERAGVPRPAPRDRGQERLVQEHVASSLTGTVATEPQERLTFAQLRAVPPVELPPASVEQKSPFPPTVAAAKETTEPLASSLFTIPLRGQSSASDARADRLVRQVRGEIEELRDAIGGLAADQGEMLHVDPADIAANPEAALTLAPAVLVRAIVAAHEGATQAARRERHRAKRLSKLQARLRKSAIEDAEIRSRLGTLEEVIAALHANLEDLRLERGGLRMVDGDGQATAAVLPPIAGQHGSGDRGRLAWDTRLTEVCAEDA